MMSCNQLEVTCKQVLVARCSTVDDGTGLAGDHTGGSFQLRRGVDVLVEISTDNGKVVRTERLSPLHSALHEDLHWCKFDAPIGSSWAFRLIRRRNDSPTVNLRTQRPPSADDSDKVIGPSTKHDDVVEDGGRHLDGGCTELVDSTTENRTTGSKIPDGTDSYRIVSSADATTGEDDIRTVSIGIIDEESDMDFAEMMRNFCHAATSSVPSSPFIDGTCTSSGITDESTCTQDESTCTETVHRDGVIRRTAPDAEDVTRSVDCFDTGYRYLMAPESTDDVTMMMTSWGSTDVRSIRIDGLKTGNLLGDHPGYGSFSQHQSPVPDIGDGGDVRLAEFGSSPEDGIASVGEEDLLRLLSTIIPWSTEAGTDVIEELVDLNPALSFNDSELNDPWSTARDTSFTEAIPDSTYDSELSGDAWSLACDASLADVVPQLSEDNVLNNPLSAMLDDSLKTPRELIDDQTLASLGDTSMSDYSGDDFDDDSIDCVLPDIPEVDEVELGIELERNYDDRHDEELNEMDNISTAQVAMVFPDIVPETDHFTDMNQYGANFAGSQSLKPGASLKHEDTAVKAIELELYPALELELRSSEIIIDETYLAERCELVLTSSGKACVSKESSTEILQLERAASWATVNKERVSEQIDLQIISSDLSARFEEPGSSALEAHSREPVELELEHTLGVDKFQGRVGSSWKNTRDNKYSSENYEPAIELERNLLKADVQDCSGNLCKNSSNDEPLAIELELERSSREVDNDERCLLELNCEWRDTKTCENVTDIEFRHEVNELDHTSREQVTNETCLHRNKQLDHTILREATCEESGYEGNALDHTSSAETTNDVFLHEPLETSKRQALEKKENVEQFELELELERKSFEPTNCMIVDVGESLPLNHGVSQLDIARAALDGDAEISEDADVEMVETWDSNSTDCEETVDVETVFSTAVQPHTIALVASSDPRINFMWCDDMNLRLKFGQDAASGKENFDEVETWSSDSGGIETAEPLADMVMSTTYGDELARYSNWCEEPDVYGPMTELIRMTTPYLPPDMTHGIVNFDAFTTDTEDLAINDDGGTVDQKALPMSQHFDEQLKLNLMTRDIAGTRSECSEDDEADDRGPRPDDGLTDEPGTGYVVDDCLEITDSIDLARAELHTLEAYLDLMESTADLPEASLIDQPATVGGIHLGVQPLIQDCSVSVLENIQLFVQDSGTILEECALPLTVLDSGTIPEECTLQLSVQDSGTIPEECAPQFNGVQPLIQDCSVSVLENIQLSVQDSGTILEECALQLSVQDSGTIPEECAPQFNVDGSIPLSVVEDSTVILDDHVLQYTVVETITSSAQEITPPVVEHTSEYTYAVQNMYLSVSNVADIVNEYSPDFTEDDIDISSSSAENSEATDDSLSKPDSLPTSNTSISSTCYDRVVPSSSAKEFNQFPVEGVDQPSTNCCVFVDEHAQTCSSSTHLERDVFVPDTDITAILDCEQLCVQCATVSSKEDTQTRCCSVTKIPENDSADYSNDNDDLDREVSEVQDYSVYPDHDREVSYVQDCTIISDQDTHIFIQNSELSRLFDGTSLSLAERHDDMNNLARDFRSHSSVEIISNVASEKQLFPSLNDDTTSDLVQDVQDSTPFIDRSIPSFVVDHSTALGQRSEPSIEGLTGIPLTIDDLASDFDIPSSDEKPSTSFIPSSIEDHRSGLYLSDRDVVLEQDAARNRSVQQPAAHRTWSSNRDDVPHFDVQSTADVDGESCVSNKNSGPTLDRRGSSSAYDTAKWLTQELGHSTGDSLIHYDVDSRLSITDADRQNAQLSTPIFDNNPVDKSSGPPTDSETDNSRLSVESYDPSIIGRFDSLSGEEEYTSMIAQELNNSTFVNQDDRRIFDDVTPILPQNVDMVPQSSIAILELDVLESSQNFSAVENRDVHPFSENPSIVLNSYVRVVSPNPSAVLDECTQTSIENTNAVLLDRDVHTLPENNSCDVLGQYENAFTENSIAGNNRDVHIITENSSIILGQDVQTFHQNNLAVNNRYVQMFAENLSTALGQNIPAFTESSIVIRTNDKPRPAEGTAVIRCENFEPITTQESVVFDQVVMQLATEYVTNLIMELFIQNNIILERDISSSATIDQTTDTCPNGKDAYSVTQGPTAIFVDLRSTIQDEAVVPGDVVSLTSPDNLDILGNGIYQFCNSSSTESISGSSPSRTNIFTQDYSTSSTNTPTPARVGTYVPGSTGSTSTKHPEMEISVLNDNNKRDFPSTSDKCATDDFISGATSRDESSTSDGYSARIRKRRDLFARSNSRPWGKCHLQSPRHDYRYPFEVNETPDTSDDESRVSLRPSHAIITISSLSPPLSQPLTNLTLSPLEIHRNMSGSQCRLPVEVNPLQTTTATRDKSEGQRQTASEQSPLQTQRAGLGGSPYAAVFIGQSDFSINEIEGASTDFGKKIDSGDRRRQRHDRPGLWKRIKLEVSQLRGRFVRRIQSFFARRPTRNTKRQEETDDRGGNTNLRRYLQPTEQLRPLGVVAYDGSDLGHHDDRNPATDHQGRTICFNNNNQDHRTAIVRCTFDSRY